MGQKTLLETAYTMTLRTGGFSGGACIDAGEVNDNAHGLESTCTGDEYFLCNNCIGLNRGADCENSETRFVYQFEDMGLTVGKCGYTGDSPPNSFISISTNRLNNYHKCSSILRRFHR